MKPLRYIFIFFLLVPAWVQSQEILNRHWLSLSLDNNQCIEFLDWDLSHFQAFSNPSFSVGYRFAWTQSIQTELIYSYGEYKLNDAIQDQFKSLQLEGQLHPFKPQSWLVQPFFSLGFAFSQYESPSGKQAQFEIPYGVGLAFELNNHLELFVSNGSQLFRFKPRQHLSVGVRVGLDAWRDLDRDGVADKDDLCPEVFGLLALDGCPDEDWDADGFSNQVDACPEIFGSVMGCPDSDGDGTIDAQDSCKNLAGTLNGCPDADGDGFHDFEDDCPQQAGPNQGCPELLVQFETIQEEGKPIVKTNLSNPLSPAASIVNIKEDEVKGMKSGLESRDLNNPKKASDTEDESKGSEAIYSSQKDSPFEEMETELQTQSLPAQVDPYQPLVIYFESASAMVSTRYKVTLIEAYQLLMSQPGSILLIDGHTDNEGSEAANDVLSKKRALAVKAFMVNRGVQANRLRIEFFGYYAPVATNNSAQGRAKNRRVEMRVVPIQ